MELQDEVAQLKSRVEKLEKDSGLHPREHAEAITKDKKDEHLLGKPTKEMVEQMIKAFSQQWDKDSLKNLYKGEHGDEVKDFEMERDILKTFARRYELELPRAE